MRKEMSWRKKEYFKDTIKHRKHINVNNKIDGRITYFHMNQISTSNDPLEVVIL